MKIIEVFSSMQGEGMHVGRKAIFVRTWGCSKECSFCDTPGINDELYEKEMLVTDIIGELFEIREKTGINLVIITGGEPTEQAMELNQLARGLAERDFELHLETNGTGKGVNYALFDHVTLCPKDNDVQLDAILKAQSVEIKILCDISNPEDAIQLYQGLGADEDIPVTVQPLIENDNEALEAYEDLVQKDPFKQFNFVRYLPQLHKIIEVR